jgi:hypothetical protein
MLDDFNIITTSPCLPTNAVFKTNIPFCLLFFFFYCNHIKATDKAGIGIGIGMGGAAKLVGERHRGQRGGAAQLHVNSF